MYVINQDLDKIIEKTCPLFVAPAVYERKILGFNIYHETVTLGTFDSADEATAEMNRIETCANEYCVVKGFYPSNEFDSIEEALDGLLEVRDEMDF
jgi:hypothetical protein